jgi:hypothetical protein
MANAENTTGSFHPQIASLVLVLENIDSDQFL